MKTPTQRAENRHAKRWRTLTVIAQDPLVSDGNGMLRAQVRVPYEEMGKGPTGYRVQVVDYDASSNTLLKPWVCVPGKEDPYAPKEKGKKEGSKPDPPDKQLLADPKFHQQNVYAIVMRTLARFEQALGRRVSWSFGGHQLKVVPHAFVEANAFYSKEDEALYFGYFATPGTKGKPGRTVFSCLSHDVVAHETCHALLDGLRERYTDPSSPDQAAFHEGFADIVALLSVFSLKEVVDALMTRGRKGQKRVPAKELSAAALKRSTLFRMAEEMGQEMAQVRGEPLRKSVELEPDPGILNTEEFMEPHRRGEVLVAAVLCAMVEVWAARLKPLAKKSGGTMDLARVVDEGRLIADRLLTMCIRALDYCPPVHLTFGDYLSALVTADRELDPDDSRYDLRKAIIASFASFGIAPTSKFGDNERGVWGEPDMEKYGTIVYDRTHFESMQHDRDEVFRFIWENRVALRLREGAFSKVQSLRPCVRVGADGFVLHETVAEYIQILRLKPQELAANKYRRPKKDLLPDDRDVYLYGGGVLVFDEYGRLKFHIHNRLDSFDRQSERIRYLAETGYYLRQKPARKPGAKLSAFGLLHLNRALHGIKAGKHSGDGWEHNHGPQDHDHDTD